MQQAIKWPFKFSRHPTSASALPGKIRTNSVYCRPNRSCYDGELTGTDRSSRDTALRHWSRRDRSAETRRLAARSPGTWASRPVYQRQATRSTTGQWHGVSVTGAHDATPTAARCPARSVRRHPTWPWRGTTLGRQTPRFHQSRHPTTGRCGRHQRPFLHRRLPSPYRPLADGAALTISKRRWNDDWSDDVLSTTWLQATWPKTSGLAGKSLQTPGTWYSGAYTSLSRDRMCVVQSRRRSRSAADKDTFNLQTLRSDCLVSCRTMTITNKTQLTLYSTTSTKTSMHGNKLTGERV